MGNNWPIVKLSEIASNTTRPFDFKHHKYFTFINTGDILEGKFLHSQKRTKDGLPGQAKKWIKRNDILYSEIRPQNKRFALVDFDDDDYVVSTKLMIITTDDSILPKYLYLHLTQQKSIDYFQFLAESRSGTFPQITFESISHYEIHLPPIDIQQRIINAISCFDDKIELNRQMNRTLEAMARAIFKSWFVDFDPVTAKMEGRDFPLPAEVMALFPDELVKSELGLIPKGWEVKPLDDVCLVVDCLHSKKPEQKETGKLFLQVYNIGKDGRMEFSKKFHISHDDYTKWISRFEATPGDLIISKTGRVGAIAQIPSGMKAAMGRNLVGIRANNKELTQEYLRDYFLSSWMRIEKAKNTSQGTILQSLHVKNISKFRILVPLESLIQKYSNILQSIHRKMDSNDKEIDTLSGLRDTLLPKLMSGETEL